jgi:hypothetical protein
LSYVTEKSERQHLVAALLRCAFRVSFSASKAVNPYFYVQDRLLRCPDFPPKYLFQGENDSER